MSDHLIELLEKAIGQAGAVPTWRSEYASAKHKCVNVLKAALLITLRDALAEAMHVALEHTAQPGPQAIADPAFHPARMAAFLERQKRKQASSSDPFAPLSPAEKEQAFEDTVRARQADFEAGIQRKLEAKAAGAGHA